MSYFRATVLPLVACLLLITQEARANPPKVIVSIKPIHSLVAGVMAGIGVAELLISNGASPHTYALKPSDAKSLSEADLIFYIGPRFEYFLTKSLKEARGTVVALGELPELSKLAMRPGGIWEADPQRTQTENAPIDAHVWLDTRNAEVMINAIADALSHTDRENAQRYYRNAEALKARLVSLDARLRTLLEPVANRPFFVFHDAYQYFANRYKLHEAGAIAVSPERPPGARRVAEMKASIQRIGVICVFSEPQFEPSLIETIIAGTPARRDTLDAEGGTAPSGPDHYFQLMLDLGTHLSRCLSATP